MSHRSICFLILAFLFGTASAFAGVPEDLARDLKPQSGVIIMSSEGEYLVDLDAKKGVRAGDLLTVVKAGEKIVHPVTNEVLGNLDQVKGVLQVTRVKEGYSFARSIGKVEFGRGDSVRRFSGVPASFWDYTSGGRSLYDQLRVALPSLDWQGYDEAQKQKPVRPEMTAGAPPLIFVLREGRLEVRVPEFRELYTYVVTPAAPSAIVPVPAPTAPAAIVQTPAPGATTAVVQNKMSQAEGLSYPAEYGNVLVGIEVADLDGDGAQEVAAVFPHSLEVGRVKEGKYERLHAMELGFGRKVLAIDGADLDRDGRSELYLTAADNGELRSFVVAFKDGVYQIVRENIPWYFRTGTLPGEGPVLMAQRMGGLEEDFSGPVFRVIHESGSLAEGKGVAEFSGKSLYSNFPFRTEKGELFLGQLNPWDHLKILRSNGDLLWESDERFGGSEEFIERIDPGRNRADGPNTRDAFMQKRMTIGPSGEVLIPVNEGSRLLSRLRSFDKSRVVALQWNGFTMQELWHTQPQQGYLADFRLADVDNDGKNELVQGLVFSRKGFMRKGRSALGVIELP